MFRLFAPTMGSERPADGPFDWVDCGPPYGDVTETPDWDETAGRASVTEPPGTPERFVSLELGDETSVIYDQTATSAWIQSTAAVRPADAEDAAPEFPLDTGKRSPE